MSTAHATTAAPRVRASHDDVVTFVADAIARTPAQRLAYVVVPAPVVDLSRAVVAASPSSVVVWDPPAGDRVVAWGEVSRFAATGSNRFEDVRRWAEQVFGHLDTHLHGDAQAVLPRVFGGFAFAVGAAAEERWRDFGDGSFVLPRFTYRVGDGRGSLAVAVPAGDRVQAAAVAAELAQVLDALGAAATAPAPTTGVSGLSSVSHLSPTAWNEQITAAQSAIRAGDLEKVVIARRSTVETAAVLDPARVVTHLGNAYPECFAFAFARGESVFVGATPERLIARRGLSVTTEALAGSISVDAKDAPSRLQESGKDREEHDVVVRHIAARLAPISADLAHPSTPGVRVLPNVIHLCTPITATLRAKVHVVDLVALLHPTPAVGGAPTSAAVSWIAERETSPRGWYAGPVGWFDAAGDGEFAVALRSALLTGASAWVYAGAGIVRESSPTVEYDETTLKLRAALGALGISG